MQSLVPYFDALAAEVDSLTFRRIAEAVAADPAAHARVYTEAAIRGEAYMLGAVRAATDAVSDARGEEWFCRYFKDQFEGLCGAPALAEAPLTRLVGQEIPLGKALSGGGGGTRKIDLLGYDDRTGRFAIIEAKARVLSPNAKYPILLKTLLQALDYAQRLAREWRDGAFVAELQAAVPEMEGLTPGHFEPVELVLMLPAGAAEAVRRYELTLPEIQAVLQSTPVFGVAGVSLLEVPEIAASRTANDSALLREALRFERLVPAKA